MVDSSLCTGCKECIPVCPTKAITLSRRKAVVDPEKCINCGLCASACAFGAFRKTEVKK
ncbi:4Fe-4S binding protein [bacterium]|nr:4Fe-4S binding protein [bacterium]